MKVPFIDFDYELDSFKNNFESLLTEHIKKGEFIGGESVNIFEENLRNYLNAEHVITVGNGTDALEIAIKSLNLKKNSEIIIPVNTWIATAEAVVNNGYKIKFCDVNLDDYSMCMDDLKSKINKFFLTINSY